MNPCPFCAGTDLRVTGSYIRQVECLDCYAVGPPASEHENAVLRWDRGWDGPEKSEPSATILDQFVVPGLGDYRNCGEFYSVDINMHHIDCPTIWKIYMGEKE